MDWPSKRRLARLSALVVIQLATVTWGFLRIFLSRRIQPNSLLLHVGIAIAKAGAALVNFNAALLLLTMCRTTLTSLSRTQLGRYYSVGWLIPLHRTASIMLILGGLVHCAAHIGNLIMLQSRGLVRWTHPTLITGMILLCTYLLISSTSLIESIKRKKFEVFYYVHYLAPISLILLNVHGIFCFFKRSTGECAGSSTIYWIGAPAALYGIDQIWSLYRAHQFVYISKVIEHPSKVIEVQFRRPGFAFLPGQYVYIKCVAISWLEWHPFTLTSAPEEDHISVHIKIVGDWTEKFNKLLKSQNLEKVRVFVDGPYGCASQDHEKFNSIICIGAGIGQTPFASILKSLW